MNQTEVMNSKPKESPRKLRLCVNRFLFMFYGLWNLIVEFLSRPTRATLELEIKGLRATLDAQKQFSDADEHRNELLLKRIFNSEVDQQSLQRENQKILDRSNALEKEIGILKKVASDQTKRADALGKSKDAELCGMQGKYEVLETGSKELKNVLSKLQNAKNELENKCTQLEKENQEVEAALNTLNKTTEEQTSKWLRLVERKSVEIKTMDSEIALLRKANDQFQIDREETRHKFEEFKEEMDDLKKTSSMCMLEKDTLKEISIRLESEKGKLEVKFAEQGRNLEAEISKCTRKIDAQARDVTAKDEALSQMKAGSLTLKSEIETLKQAISTLKQEKSDLKDAFSRLDRTKSVMETRLNERQRIIDLQRRETKALGACVGQTKTIKDKFDKQKDSLKTFLSQLQSWKDDLQAQNHELKEDFKEVMKAAQTEASNAKEKRERGREFLQRMIEEHSEDLKMFLTKNSQTRDTQRREDLQRLEEWIEKKSSLLKSKEEIARQKIYWEGRAREAEQMNARNEQELRNGAVVVTTEGIPLQVPEMCDTF